MKRLMVLVCLTVMLASIVFAAGTAEQKVSETSKTEVRVSWWGGDPRHEKYRLMLDEYEKQNPNITVTREFSGWDGYFDKLAVQAASGNLPDVIHMHLTKVSDYAKRGAMLPLDDLVAKKIIDLTDFNQAIIDSGKIDGKIYMITLGNSITGCYYNTTVLKELGMTPPSIDWTWDTMYEYAKQVKEKLNQKNVWVVDDASMVDTAFDYFLRQRGKGLYSPDGKLGFNKQDMIDWFQMWRKFREAGITPPMTVVAEQVSDTHGDSLLAHRGVIMKISPANQLAIYQGYMKDELSFLRVPNSGTGMNGEFVEGAYIGISSNTKNAEEAGKVINFLVNSPEATLIFKAEHGALGSAKMNEFILPQLSEANRKVIEFTQYASQFAVPRVDTPMNGNEVVKLLTIAAQDVGYGTDINRAVDNFFTLASRIL